MSHHSRNCRTCSLETITGSTTEEVIGTERVKSGLALVTPRPGDNLLAVALARDRTLIWVGLSRRCPRSRSYWRHNHRRGTCRHPSASFPGLPNSRGCTFHPSYYPANLHTPPAGSFLCSQTPHQNDSFSMGHISCIFRVCHWITTISLDF